MKQLRVKFGICRFCVEEHWLDGAFTGLGFAPVVSGFSVSPCLRFRLQGTRFEFRSAGFHCHVVGEPLLSLAMRAVVLIGVATQIPRIGIDIADATSPINQMFSTFRYMLAIPSSIPNLSFLTSLLSVSPSLFCPCTGKTAARPSTTEGGKLV